MNSAPFVPLFHEGCEIHSTFDQDANLILHEGESEDFLRSIPSDEIRLIVTSPPYNIGKEYEKTAAIDEYLSKQEPLIDELIRVLAKDGSICWQVGNYVKDGEVFPLDIYYYKLFKSRGLKLRNRIIWTFAHGLHASKRFSGRYETIMWFTKSDKYVFNLDPVRVPSKYPGKRHFKGPNRGKPSGNPLGKNPSDIWTFVAQEWDRLIWEIPNVKANHCEKTTHPCQFPIELVERCILALTNEQDWVLDPYCGVGSSLLGGLNRGRRAIGVERNHEYIEITEQRIEEFFNGTLRIRPLGKPVHAPTGKEKVSQTPDEWK